MADTQLDAPQCVRQTCVQSTLVARFRSLLGDLWRGRKGKHVKHLSDHLARDIGISPARMERHRMVWPSEPPDRPRF